MVVQSREPSKGGGSWEGGLFGATLPRATAVQGPWAVATALSCAPLGDGRLHATSRSMSSNPTQMPRPQGRGGQRGNPQAGRGPPPQGPPNQQMMMQPRTPALTLPGKIPLRVRPDRAEASS